MESPALEPSSSRAGAGVHIHSRRCPAKHVPCGCPTRLPVTPACHVCSLLLPLHVVGSHSPEGPRCPTPTLSLAWRCLGCRGWLGRL